MIFMLDYLLSCETAVFQTIQASNSTSICVMCQTYALYSHMIISIKNEKVGLPNNKVEWN